MILCFYLKEVYTFKEKHKIIDVPNSPAKFPVVRHHIALI
jgi:hypothetical protein